MPELDFEFYVGGIEDAILALLKEKTLPIGVKAVDYYSGELGDTENLQSALSQLSGRFPLIMVSYAEGKNFEDPKTPKVLGRPIHYRHECTFIVMCLSNDARGETVRRRGIENKQIGLYQMISKVQTELGGMRFTVQDDDEKIPLNTPLEIADVQHIARMPNMTAYAVVFGTSFRFSTPDRSVAGNSVSEFNLQVNSLNQGNSQHQLPGVSGGSN